MKQNSKDLLELLIAETGLPPELMERELNHLIVKLGMKKDKLNLEQLRQLMTVYLQEVLPQARQSLFVD